MIGPMAIASQNLVLQQKGMSPLGAQHEDAGDKAPHALNYRLSKTKLCKYFNEGYCKQGDSCRYAHGKEELSQQPDLQKTKMCQEFLRGNCQKGDCTFAHGVTELR